MGFFDAVSGAFDFVGDFLGSDAGSGLLQAGATVAGNVISSNANQAAARDVAAATDRRTAAIQEGNAAAQARFDELAGLTQPGIDALRRITAHDPYQLTPQQRLALDDVRRASVTSLNKSGLRGAGRANLAALRGTESDFFANAVDTNLGRRDAAARQLAGDFTQSIGRAANIDERTGRSLGEGELAKGSIRAGADLANANLRGAAIGDIASIIAGEEKARGRSSKFSKDDDDDRSVPVGGRI